MYRAELLLPINSPIKETIKLKMPLENKKLAQMAVALEVSRVSNKLILPFFIILLFAFFTF